MKNKILVLMYMCVFLFGNGMSVSSSYLVFNNDNIQPATITISNNDVNDYLINSVTLKGSHEDEFNITFDGCTRKTLYYRESCEINVTFLPKTKGIKNAILNIQYTAGELNVFLTNYEDNSHNVKRRLPPVMYDMNISDVLDANSTYTFKWSIIGYDDEYKVMISMFDCSVADDGLCGNSYGANDMLSASDLLSPASIEDVNWTYKDQMAHKFNFSYSTTIPATGVGGHDWNTSGTDIVVRFYVISNSDDANNLPSLSLIIPGNLADQYYDSTGRKIVKKICPSDGCE